MSRRKAPKISVQKFPPPLPLAWALLPPGPGHAARLHKLHYRAIWRSLSAPRCLEMAFLLLCWPFLLMPRIIEMTRRNGAMVKARTGKSLARQMSEQMWLAARFGFRPQAYYTMEFFRPERAAQAGDYIHRYVVKDGLYRRIKRKIVSPLTDKVGFARFCKAHELPAAALEMSLVDGKIESGSAPLPAADLFVKRTRGRGGARSELWLYENGRYHMRGGGELDGPALIDRLIDLSQREPYIVQRRHINHPLIADLSPGALATVRVVTLIDEKGGFEVVRAVFRMGTSEKSIVDNFHAGGVAAPVDLATGALGRATDFGLAPSLGWVDIHPATGARITGRVLPQWDEIAALARRAHAAFADRVVIGWDIAITASGMLLVEGNGAPDVDNIQRPHGTPLGLSRYGALMDWHLLGGGLQST
ncbi:MAG: hypothetical protein HYU58_12395 [Proteobacteria bacterium]|nr:hypothetical protein [Pseudomonadota bacterium]